MSNFLILMSGGTTPVINSTLSGILKTLKSKRVKIYSGNQGIVGVLKNSFLNLSNFSISKIKKIAHVPGSHFIGTTRMQKLKSKEISILRNSLKKKNITNVINIGGNGTLQQSRHLAEKLPEINFISCPKTVDNDLGDKNFRKVLFNPGYISCVEIWSFFLKMINIENIGAHSHDKVIISQTFGRDTGFICGSLRYWDKKRNLPMMLLLPENKKNFEDIYIHAKKILQKYHRLMIFISEGYNLGNIKPKYDKSGQVMYGSSGNTNCQILNNLFMKKKIQSRIFNPTILQRVFKFRRELLNKKDIVIAEKIGRKAALTLLNKKKSFLVTVTKKNKIDLIDYKFCKNFSRKMPSKFILKNKFDVSDDFLNYLDEVFKK